MTRTERRARTIIRILRGMGFSNGTIVSGVRTLRITDACAKWTTHGHDHRPLNGCAVHGA